MRLPYFSDLDIVMAGSDENHEVTVENHHPLFYGVQYHHRGTLLLTIDHGCQYRLQEPVAFITVPGHSFVYGPPEGETRHHNYICFTGQRVDAFLQKGLICQKDLYRPITIRYPDKFLQTIHKVISQVFTEQTNHNRGVILLEDLLLQLQEQENNAAGHPIQTPYLTYLLSEISLRPEVDYKWEEIARGANLSLVQFRRVFKQYSGLSPHQFLLQKRLLKAADFLANTSTSVKSVAAQVGIENEFYFSRLFKNKYGLSPTEYRHEFQ